MPQITLIKGDAHGDETDYRDNLPVNCSAIIRPVLGVQGYMLQQPGLTQYGTGFGVDRGGIWNERQSKHLRVSDNKLMEVLEDGTAIDLGEITGSDTVSLPYSFNTQAIIANFRMYLFDGTTLTEITDPDLGNPIDGVWINGVYLLTDGENLYHTELIDESSIDALTFGTAEFMPDGTLGVAKTSDNKAAVFGRYTLEYFVDRAQPQFRFGRIETRGQKIGIVGTHCKCEMLDRFWIMGGRKEESVGIHTVTIGSIIKISSREVDKVIKTYTEEQLATGVLEARVENGYHYLIVHLPNDTFLFCHELGQSIGIELAWTRLKSDVLGDRPWRGIHGVYETRRSQWVYGDKRDTTLGFLDDTVATHYGDLAEGILFTPFIWLNGDSIDQLEIETIPGHTIVDDATVLMSLSYNGVTYGTESAIPYGAPSEFGRKFIVRRLGNVNQWFTLKLRFASQSRMAFSRAMINEGI